MRALAAADPRNVEWQKILVVNLVQIASLDDCPAQEVLNEALAILERLPPDGWADQIRQKLTNSHGCG
jgi:hypothetical protein